MGAVQDEKNHRLPLLDPQGINREQRELYDRIAADMLPWAKESGFEAATEDGRLLGPFNALLYNAELGAAHLNYLQTERNATALDAAIREVVILTVGAAVQAPYELYAHRAVAARAGIAADDIEALANGQAPKGMSEDAVAAQRFVLALARDHRVPDDVYQQAFKAFGHKCLVDMVHLVGLYLATAALLNAFAVPVPEA